MKKIKFLLTALTVVALVGGGLAFKAMKFGTSSVFCSSNQTCVFSSWQIDKIDGAATTTEPCGAGVDYYLTNANACAQDPVTPGATTLYANPIR